MRLFQNERVCILKFWVWWNEKQVIQTNRKHWGKRRNCSLRAISPFPTVFSKRLILRIRKNQGLFGKGLKQFKTKMLLFKLWNLALKGKERRKKTLGRRENAILHRNWTIQLKSYVTFFVHKIVSLSLIQKSSALIPVELWQKGQSVKHYITKAIRPVWPTLFNIFPDNIILAFSKLKAFTGDKFKVACSFPKRQILDSSELKLFPDDNFRFDENGSEF